MRPVFWRRWGSIVREPWPNFIDLWWVTGLISGIVWSCCLCKVIFHQVKWDEVKWENLEVDLPFKRTPSPSYPREKLSDILCFVVWIFVCGGLSAMRARAPRPLYKLAVAVLWDSDKGVKLRRGKVWRKEWGTCFVEARVRQPKVTPRQCRRARCHGSRRALSWFT